MVQLLLIAAIAATHMGRITGLADPWITGRLSWVAAWAPMAVLWLAFHVFAQRCGHRMDEQGDVYAAVRAERSMNAARFTGTAWHIVSVFIAPIPGLTTGSEDWFTPVLSILPVLALFIGLWWSFHPLDLRVREATLRRRLEHTPVHPPLTRVQYVWFCVRHQLLLILLPYCLLSAWAGVSDALGDRMPAWTRFAGIGVVLIASPAVLRAAWDTVLIGPGSVRDRARRMLRQYGVHARGPYLWRTHGSMVNGAILGVFYPLRYLLLTDALLDRLDDRHLDGVLAHEVAHVKLRHLPWLAVSVIASVLVAGWACALAGHTTGIPAEAAWFDGAASVVSLTAAGLTIGIVSRRFEWQADAFAARHLSIAAGSAVITRDGAETMSDALQAVADLNGIPIARFSWRHGSIGTRQERLAGIVGIPCDRLPIDLAAKRLKAVALIALVSGLVPFWWV